MHCSLLKFRLKFCPSLLESVGLRVPARYMRDLSLFDVCSPCNNCPSTTYASAALLFAGTLTNSEPTLFS
jgi:hypothetical protein